MVKAVIFDFYNTLAETTNYGPSWEELLDELGYSLPPDIRDRWWNDGIDGTEHDEHSQSRDHYVAWQQSRVRSMLERVRGARAPRTTTSSCGCARSAPTTASTRTPRSPTSSASLRAQGVALAICSNWDWDLHEAVESAGLTGAFDVVVSSAWVGARKAHPRIYTHTLEQLGVAPEDALFVGDTWTCDVDGPRAAGMRAIYLRRAHLGADHTAPDAGARPDDVHHALDLRAVESLRLLSRRSDRPRRRCRRGSRGTGAAARRASSSARPRPRRRSAPRPPPRCARPRAATAARPGAGPRSSRGAPSTAGVAVDPREIDDVHPQLLGQKLDEVAVGDEAEVDENLHRSDRRCSPGGRGRS